MRKLVALAALLVAAAVPSAASAQFFVGARLGYSIPWGDAVKDSPMKDGIKAEIPIQIDAGLKLGKALAVGVYGSYAIGMLASDITDGCDAASIDCSANEIRFGVQANLHAANTPNSEFWGGVAVGYAKLTQKIDTFEAGITGFEAALQGGLDYLASPSFRIGPYASLSAGQYSKYTGDLDGDVADKAIHGFITIGLRGMFGN